MKTALLKKATSRAPGYREFVVGTRRVGSFTRIAVVRANRHGHDGAPRYRLNRSCGELSDGEHCDGLRQAFRAGRYFLANGRE